MANVCIMCHGDGIAQFRLPEPILVPCPACNGHGIEPGEETYPEYVAVVADWEDSRL